MRLALALVVLAALPASASASTARVVADYSWCADFCGKIGGSPDLVVVYDAGPGEANRLTVARDGRSITVSDPAAAVSVVPPCVARDAHTASCDGGSARAEGSDWVSVRLGDGDDGAVVVPGAATLAVLLGGEGSDELLGGDGDDLIDGGAGADRLDGGAGWNRLSFRGRREGVTVDLAAGRTSDGDSVANIKTVVGGHGDDRLLGSRGDDGLLGWDGDDTLHGRGGEDTLFGERGADRLDGGGGDDQLYGGTGADRLNGGGGDDQLYGESGADSLFSGAGRDRLFGGADRDRVHARDGFPDRADCGGGRDHAEIDAKDHVHACETLRRRGYTGSR